MSDGGPNLAGSMAGNCSRTRLGTGFYYYDPLPALAEPVGNRAADDPSPYNYYVGSRGFH